MSLVRAGPGRAGPGSHLATPSPEESNTPLGVFAGLVATTLRVTGVLESTRSPTTVESGRFARSHQSTIKISLGRILPAAGAGILLLHHRMNLVRDRSLVGRSMGRPDCSTLSQGARAGGSASRLLNSSPGSQGAQKVQERARKQLRRQTVVRNRIQFASSLAVELTCITTRLAKRRARPSFSSASRSPTTKREPIKSRRSGRALTSSSGNTSTRLGTDVAGST